MILAVDVKVTVSEDDEDDEVPPAVEPDPAEVAFDAFGTHRSVNDGMSAPMRWIHLATASKSRAEAEKLTVPDGPDATTGAGVTGAGVVVSVEPPAAGAGAGVGAGAAAAAWVTVPWKEVNQTSDGIVREMACKSDDHETSLAKSAWVSVDSVSIWVWR